MWFLENRLKPGPETLICLQNDFIGTHLQPETNSTSYYCLLHCFKYLLLTNWSRWKTMVSEKLDRLEKLFLFLFFFWRWHPQLVFFWVHYVFERAVENFFNDGSSESPTLKLSMGFDSSVINRGCRWGRWGKDLESESSPNLRSA